jgi:HEAT repeat protein
LAAVAQAANASNKSPAEAAEIAKAHALNMAKQQQQHSGHRRGPGQQAPAPTHAPPAQPPRKIQPVHLESVKSLLRSELAAIDPNTTNCSSSRLIEKLANGDNDAFLQQLLMMEYMKGIGSDVKEAPQNQNETHASKASEDMQSESWKTNFACERVKMLLGRVEAAYDAMEYMLPQLSEHDQLRAEIDASMSEESDDIEIPKIVPDLLPPCTSANGDSTLEFFRACLGSDDEDGHNHNNTLDDVTATTSGMSSELHSGHEGLQESASVTPDGHHVDEEKHGSMFSGVFSMKRPSFRNKSLVNVFGKKKKAGKGEDEDDHRQENPIDPSMRHVCKNGEYIVIIEREMLGLTVENVLERTVVRTVLAGGPAKKAGAKVGSLIVKVGNIETKNLTHFETIDELRQSQRPLQLVLRQIPEEALRSAREEMGRLIRGSGFGRIMDGEMPPPVPPPVHGATLDVDEPHRRLPQQGTDRSLDLYSSIVRKRWIDAVNLAPRTKKDEPILRVGEKLVWIMTMFIVGLEREADRLFTLAKNDETEHSEFSRHSQYHHSGKDYADAAKSASKILSDFVQKRMDPVHTPPSQPAGIGGRMGGRGIAGRGRGRGRGGRGPIGGRGELVDESSTERLLMQIGDVLQRMRTFLADPTSPPAALLRGELIGCLCDILDADTEMKLSEEESVSMTQGGGRQAGPITDLGAAGSLLKLIVLNCPIMRSPACEEISPEERNIDEDELKRRFGGKKAFSNNDYHRLHAGNRFLAVVHRLAASRSTSARITACSLGPVLWSHLDFPHQLQLRGVITRALHDVEVIVRKSTATVLHEIAELVFDSRCVPWLVLMCERAMTDPEPLLRSAAMTLTWHLAEHLPNAFLGDASKGSRYLRRLPSREDPIFADVYLLQCKLLPVATRLAEDRAPQVRIAVAAQCDRLCDALGDHWSSVIIDVLVALLSDSDDRVRAEAVLCVPRLADIVLLSSPPGVIPAGESSVLDALLPAAIKLQKDPSSQVRIALATAAGEMLTLLVGLQRQEEQPPKETANAYGPVSIRYEKRHVDERLIPLVQKLLNDPDPEVTSSALRAVTNASRGSNKAVRPRFDTEDDDSKSVTSLQSHTTASSVEKKDPVFLPVLSEEQVLRLLPTLSDLANSKQWRVRQSAVEIVPALLGCTDKFETRAEIARMCIKLTCDRVDAVRKTAAECLCLGGSSLGSHGEDVSGEWITALVIPQVQSCAKNADYRQRLLCLKMVEVVLLNDVCPAKWKDEAANAEGKNTPLRELLKLTLSLADDKIANVRLNVGRVLCSVINVFAEDECRVIKYAMLQQLKKEKTMEGRQDRDVNYFATKCLEKVRTKLHQSEAEAPKERKNSESSSASSASENERQVI